MHEKKLYITREYPRRVIAAGWVVAFGIGAGAMYALLSTTSAHSADRTQPRAASRAGIAARVEHSAAGSKDKSAAQLALLSELTRLTRAAHSEQQATATAQPEEPAPADEKAVLEKQEIELLQQALPDNTLVPRRRTEADQQRQLADIQEQQRLNALIKANTAAERDRHLYYELQAKRFEDELELTDYCDDKLAGSDSAQSERYPLCSQVSARSVEVHRAAETSLALLRQDLL